MILYIKKYWQWLLTLFFGVTVFLFWFYPYKSVLSFQEQYQLFLFSKSYLMQFLAFPGGVCSYLGSFLTQFYFVPFIGAIILAVLFVILQRLTWLLSNDGVDTGLNYLFSFVPSIILWRYMGDENVMLSFVISLILVQVLTLVYQKIRLTKVRYIYILMAVPLFYWFFGISVYIFVFYVLIYELLKKNSLLSILSLFIVLVTIVLVSLFVQYPFYRLFLGIGYYRYPMEVPYLQFLTIAVFSVWPYLMNMIPTKWSDKIYKKIVTAGVIIIGGAFFVAWGYNTLKYDLIDYDYLVRTGQWEILINKAEKRQASTPMGVACVNLALVKTNQLGDRIFEFYQNGADGLIPPFQRDMFTPVSTGEIFYNLGMVNDAQRYFFEAQEAIPDYQKSGRLTKRLAETNLINGDYKVAAKYLRTLEKTLFYKDWAEKTMTILGHENEINKSPMYGHLRQFRQKKHDYLFSDTEMDQMLGLLFAGDYNNRMAYEYLMAYELLQRDLTRFMKYYPLGKFVNYDHIPISFQEALVYMWTQTHSSFEGMPWSISPAVCNGVSSFAQTYMANRNDQSLANGPLGKTFWSYLLVNKENESKKGKEKMATIY